MFTHRDIPGVIGNVGSVLAEEKINVAQMAVGRRSNDSGGSAIGVLNLDTPCSESALKKILDFEGIESADLISLPTKGEVPSWLA